MAKNTVLDKAIRLCDVSREEKAQNFREFDRKILRFRGTGTWKEFCDLSDQITKVYNNGGLLKSDSATLQKHYSQIERYVLSREREKAIAANSGGKMESFITLNEAKIFAEKLKKQGIKATITGVEDKRNGVYVYRVMWN